MGRVKLVIEYDGSGFAGWQTQPGKNTVQGRLQETLTTVLRQPTRVRGAGRTDAGVHASGQVADALIPDETDLSRLMWSVNALLRPGIAVKAIQTVADDFDPRRHAKLRTYSYTLLNRRHASPLLRGRYWWVPEDLNVAEMEKASECLRGRHDFGAFVAAGGLKKTSTVTVRAIAWKFPNEQPGLMRFEISADAFLYHMVRLIVGTLVWVGKGKMSAADFEMVLLSKDVTRAAPMAPPEGLVLEEVVY